MYSEFQAEFCRFLQIFFLINLPSMKSILNKRHIVKCCFFWRTIYATFRFIPNQQQQTTIKIAVKHRMQCDTTCSTFILVIVEEHNLFGNGKKTYRWTIWICCQFSLVFHYLLRWCNRIHCVMISCWMLNTALISTTKSQFWRPFL